MSYPQPERAAESGLRSRAQSRTVAAGIAGSDTGRQAPSLAAMARARRSRSGLQAAALEAIRLACDFRMTPSSSTFRPLALQRRAGGGDVDDQLGEAGGRRALGGAQALDDAVAGDALAGEEAARQVHVLGGDAHLPAVRAAVGRAPSPPGPPCAARRASRPAPPPPRRRGRSRSGARNVDALVGIGDGLADQVLAGDAEVGAAGS